MKRMLRDLLILLIGGVLGLAGLATQKQATPAGGPGLITTDTGPTLEAVQSLAKLVTTSVTVSEVQLTELRGYTGGAKAAFIVRGDLRIGTDLSKAALTRIDAVTREAVLLLPQPTMDPPRIDLERTQLVTVESNGLWAVLPGNAAETRVTGEALRQAQQSIERIGMKPDWAEQARRHASDVLEAFYAPTGWRVQVCWAPGA